MQNSIQYIYIFDIQIKTLVTNVRNLTDHLPLDVALSYYKSKVYNTDIKSEFSPVVSVDKHNASNLFQLSKSF